MKKTFSTLFITLLTLNVSYLSSAQGASASKTAQLEPYPLEYWALRNVMTRAEVSPSGKYLATLQIPTKNGDPIIEVYETSGFSDEDTSEPFRINAKPMEIQTFDWINDKTMVVLLRQKIRDKIEGFNQGVYGYALAKVDVDSQKVQMFRDNYETLNIVNILPNEPNKIIISLNEQNDGRSVDDGGRYRPASYYEFNLETGAKRLLIRGKISLGQIEFDGNGNPWLARGFETSEDEYTWYYRKIGENDWTEFFRLHEDSFETFSVVGFDENNRNIAFVIANNGFDTAGLWEFHLDKKQFGEVIYRRPDVNVAGVRMHSNNWTNPDTVVGIATRLDKTRIEYFDPIEEATYKQLDSLVGNAYNSRIASRSQDGQALTVFNSGPKDPGTFYLLANGKFTKLGGHQPLLEGEKLADVKFITYKARDGKSIPAFITIPHGQPPFPTVVMPHGGPFVHETVGYDEWAQMLANNGYLVLQPQYRGSTGYGLEFYTSAFVNGGQGGYKMQDDKDDGVLHLIKEGLADKDRVAMYGWSYGGYAALVAASREEQLYQCVIAGAAVADTAQQVNYYRYRLRGASEIEQINMWDDSISPIEEVAKVNVPILLIHGSVDQRVPPAHAEKYRKELEKHSKTFKYVELDGADHFSNTLFYEHQIELYESMTSFLKNDCGPGGL